MNAQQNSLIDQLVSKYRREGQENFFFFTYAHGSASELLQDEMTWMMGEVVPKNSYEKGFFKTYKLPLAAGPFEASIKFMNRSIFTLLSGLQLAKTSVMDQELALQALFQDFPFLRLWPVLAFTLPPKKKTGPLLFQDLVQVVSGHEGQKTNQQKMQKLPVGAPYLAILVDEKNLWINLCFWKKSSLSLLLPPEFFQEKPASKFPPPSKAYFKIKEAHFLHQIPFQAGEQVLEIGAAPGGVTTYLLEQNLEVVSVDPAQMGSMNPAARFTHLQKTLQQLSWIDLEAINFFPDWVVVDLNLTPELGLSLLMDFFRTHRTPEKLKQIKGFFFVLKMGDKTSYGKMQFLYKKYTQAFARISPLIQLHAQKKEAHFWAEGPLQFPEKNECANPVGH